MRDLLLVMNPRQIDVCLDSYTPLRIDKLYIRRMTEKQIAEHWHEVMAAADGYDRMLIISDDGIVHQHALDAVIRLLDDGHPVATGYSNLSATDYRVNLCRAPLGPFPHPDHYDLYTLKEVMEHPEPELKSWLAGFCLTGMTYQMWERFPYIVYPDYGAQSDFMMSKTLEENDVPITAAREGFVFHVKDVWNLHDTDPRKKSYVGIEPPELVWDRVGKPQRAKVLA